MPLWELNPWRVHFPGPRAPKPENPNDIFADGDLRRALAAEGFDHSGMTRQEMLDALEVLQTARGPLNVPLPKRQFPLFEDLSARLKERGTNLTGRVRKILSKKTKQ